MGAARDGVGGEVVLGSAQYGDAAAVQFEVRQPAAGHRAATGAVRRETEVAHGQPYVPAALGVRGDLDADGGRALLGDLTVGTALLVPFVQEFPRR
ncbi:hypothetical protein SHKM778_65900 [Streptomyces sp. KM77-8]|uniref:Uncharacterized protein n=1 Tax=Streptomyces haneummycinicus TaxID=3074435 RepID=A0AAT9HS51_9ACTN